MIKNKKTLEKMAQNGYGDWLEKYVPERETEVNRNIREAHKRIYQAEKDLEWHYHQRDQLILDKRDLKYLRERDLI